MLNIKYNIYFVLNYVDTFLYPFIKKIKTNINEKNFIYVFMFLLFCLYSISASIGDFGYNIFSDRDLLRSFDILDNPMGGSAEMSFSTSGSKIPGASEYYIYKLFMLVSTSPKWIAFCIYISFIVSVLFFYKTVIFLVNDKKISFIATSVYAFSAVTLQQFNFIWNPSLVPFLSIMSLYFLVKSNECHYIKNISLSFLFAFLAMQMHLSTVVFLFFIMFYVALDKRDIKDKLLLFFIVPIIFFVAYASYFLNTDFSALSNIQSNTFLYKTTNVFFILVFYGFILSFVSCLGNKDNRRYYLLTLVITGSIILYIVFSIGNINNDNKIYNFKNIPVTYQFALNKKLFTNIKKTVMQEDYHGVINYEDEYDKPLFSPSINILIEKQGDNPEISFSVDSYSPIKQINKKISSLLKRPYYIFMIIGSFLMIVVISFKKEDNWFIVVSVHTVLLVSFFMVMSFMNMYVYRYIFIEWSLFIVCLFYFYHKYIKVKAYDNKVCYFIIFAILVYIPFYSYEQSDQEVISEGVYKNTMFFYDYVKQNGGEIKNASMFNIFNNKIYRTRTSEGISFYYKDRLNKTRLENKQADNNHYCFSLNLKKPITIELLNDFYKRRIGDGIKITDFEVTSLFGNLYYMSKYKTNGLRCYTTFENKYIDNYGDNLKSGDNVIIEDYRFLSFKLLFNNNSLVLYSRKLRGLGFDGEKHNNVLVRNMTVDLYRDNKTYNFTLISNQDVGVLGLNTPIIFHKTVPNGVYKYKIKILSTNRAGESYLLNHIDYDQSFRLDSDLFSNSAFEGTVTIKH